MTKQKITISLDSEIAEKLRLQSIEKYGNSRSMSRLIEDLATGAAEAEQPETCSILGHRSVYSFKAERDFKCVVDKITAHLRAFDMTYIVADGREFSLTKTQWYFALKEACELELNKYADMVNKCLDCNGIDRPLPRFSDAGRNFEIFATMDSSLR
jgi:hypothetical protein